MKRVDIVDMKLCVFCLVQFAAFLMLVLMMEAIIGVVSYLYEASV